MYIDTQIFSSKTVPSSYSWDQGNPTLTMMELCSASAEGQLIGYAPFCSVQVKSIIGKPNTFTISNTRKMNFGDYYNSETNTQTRHTSGYEIFYHNYIMPGEYTLTLEQTQYFTLNNQDSYTTCLQKYCLNWSWESRQCVIDSEKNISWNDAMTGGKFVKKWAYEHCEDNNLGTYDMYVERGQTSEERPSFCWQWYNFYNEEEHDEMYTYISSYEPKQERLPTTDLPRTWDDAVFQGPQQITWDDMVGPSIETRNSDASWRWNKVLSNSNQRLNQKITWKKTKKGDLLPRLWRQIRGAGCVEPVLLLSSTTLTTTKTSVIKILEIPPTAYLNVEIQSQTNSSPVSVRLSPKYVRCGSFPIEKIVWDFGDGSELLVQNRYNVNKNEPFVYSDQFGFDVEDPRNYDVLHTYYRTDVYSSCFYPSITAYSSSTDTADCAAAIVGPLEFQINDSANFHLLQNKLTDKGTAYIGQINQDISMWNHRLSAF